MKKYIIICLALIVSCTTQKETVRDKEFNLALTDSIAKLLKQIETLQNHDGDGVPDYIDVDPKVKHLTVGSGYHSNSPTIIYHSTGSVIDPAVIENTKYNLGYLTYYIPDTMKVGTQYRIELRITKYKTVEFVANLDTHRVESKVRIAHKMEAKLTDIDKAFAITTDNTPEQSVEMDKSFTRWVWYVTPTKSGKHGLKLTVVIKEENLVKDIPVYENSIYVQSAPLYSTTSFFEKYWQWLISTLVIPFGIWFYNRKKKKKKSA